MYEKFINQWDAVSYLDEMRRCRFNDDPLLFSVDMEMVEPIILEAIMEEGHPLLQLCKRMARLI